MTSLELLICGFLISVSAYMSSSEIALFSLSRFQLRSLKEHLRASAFRKIKRLLADPGGLLISILVINEVVNVALSTLIAKAVSRLDLGSKVTFTGLPHWVIDTLIGTVLTAPLILFLCEITPKAVGAKANQLIASLTIEPMSFTYDLLRPVRKVLTRFVAVFSTWADPGQRNYDHKGGEDVLKEADFLLMLEEGHREGAIHDSELGLIRRVFELDDTTVSDIYKPLSQVQTLPAQTPLLSALTAIRSQNYSRIPIASSSRKIVGILYSKDLLRSKLDPGSLTYPVSVKMRKPLFVPPTLRLNSLFRKFKQEKTHMAIVQTENEESLGIVTMADVLDALFEDLLVDGESAAGRFDD